MRPGLLAVLLLVACSSDDGGGGDALVGSTARPFCVQETNRYRAMHGKPALAASPPLESYADTGAMIDWNATPHQHFTTTSGGGIAFAENECPRWNLEQQGGGDMVTLVAACIAAFEAEGPGSGDAHGHYNNMMGDYAALGCGIYQAGSSVTIVQDYGP